MPKTRQPNPASRERSKRESGRLEPVNTRLVLLICLVLAILTLAAYSRVHRCDFVNCDDDEYVTENLHVQSLTWENITWAFNVGYASNWHPVTWISHMVDYRLFGLNAAGHHLINLLLHLANSLLLVVILTRMTGSVWRSGFVAALFAIHPLHVESVAWVAERKDVLSALFFMLTILAYLRYVGKPSVRRYLPVPALFALGLMAKPMLVTLPFVLLLLDYWPLGRVRQAWRLVGEKLPLMLMAAGSSVLTYLAQQKGGAVSAFEAMPLGIRISNATVSYASYILKILWPQHLAAAYPHPGDKLSALMVIMAAAFLSVLTYMAVRTRRRRPYLLVGWLWFLGTLVPVIGLIQVGAQALADRYTYIPMTGLLIMLAWGIPDALGEWGKGRSGKEALVGVSGAIMVTLAVLTWIQVGYWRDDITLYTHAIAVTRENYIAHNGLGSAYAELGETENAVREYRESIRMNPDNSFAQTNLAAMLQRQGKLTEAAEIGLQAAGRSPQSAEIHYNTGLILHEKGDLDGAIGEYQKAIRIRPDFPQAHNNLAAVYYFKADYADAWKEVYLCRSQGGNPHPEFLQELAKKMPDPGK